MEPNIKRWILPCLIIIGTLLVIVVGYSFLPLKKIPNTMQIDENTILVESDGIQIKKAKPPSITVSNDLRPNTKPKFKVGQKLKYNYNTIIYGSYKNLKLEYEVKGIDIMDHKKCYNVEIKEEHLMLSSSTRVTSKEKNISQDEEIHNEYLSSCIDVENGEIKYLIKKDTNENMINEERKYKEGIGIYAPWMLALDDNMKWKVSINTSEYIDNPNIVLHENFEVVEREVVNNKECFKVVVSHTSETTKGLEKVDKRVIMWINVNERIIEKGQVFVGNLKTDEITLVDETI